MKNKCTLMLSIVLTLFITSCFRSNSKYTELVSLDQELPANATFRLASTEDLYQFMTFDEDRYPLVSAHRGGPTENYPENAIATFANVAKNMPAIIECDIRLSKDSVMVLMHDETLDRTTNAKGKVNTYTLKELKRLRLKDNSGDLTPYDIPTLEEALAWGKGKVIFTLDVKNDVPYAMISQAIQKHNAQAYCIIITYSANQAQAVYRTDPNLMISATIRNQKDMDLLTQKEIPDNLLVAFIGTRQADKVLIDRLHDHGIKTILGTIGNLDKQADSRGYQVYADYIENGADILSTDRPFEAHKALSYYIHKRGITSPYIND